MYEYIINKTYRVVFQTSANIPVQKVSISIYNQLTSEILLMEDLQYNV